MTWNEREREKEREKENLGYQLDLSCQTIFDIFKLAILLT